MLTWNGTDSDLIELVRALMAAGAIRLEKWWQTDCDKCNSGF